VSASRLGRFTGKENNSRCLLNTRLTVLNVFQTDVPKNWGKTTNYEMETKKH